MKTSAYDLSLIIPTFQEESNLFYRETLATYSSLKLNKELIVVDGGSKDATVKMARDYGAKVIVGEGFTRAAKLNSGLTEASGEWIVLHHPRSVLMGRAFQELVALAQPCWGGFTHQFRRTPLTSAFQFTSWYSNSIRFDLKGIVYLDHCLFLHHSLRETLLPIPNMPIFEDTEISLKLRKWSHPVRLPSIAETSPIRFERNGFVRQALLNQILKLRYILRGKPEEMNRRYEKDLHLNG